MSIRRSVRLNPNYRPDSISTENEMSNSESASVQENQNELKQEVKVEEEIQKNRYFNDPKIQEVIIEDEKIKKEAASPEKAVIDVEMADEKSSENASATVKACNKMNSDVGDKRRVKKPKFPTALKRKNFNQKLAKLLTPKNALILLNELKSNCIYKVQEQVGCNPPSFCAQVLHNGEVLGAGKGLSKSHAKNSAAENAIKTIVSNTMSRHTQKLDSDVEMKETEDEDSPENLPWVGLASFAIYKMFSEWQTQGGDLLTRPFSQPKAKSPVVQNAPIKKELPPNARELHPAVVLNMMYPGLVAVEIEREETPKCRVKMGYTVNGKTFTGVGGNKKDAKKEAAKAVLEGVFGLTYPQ